MYRAASATAVVCGVPVWHGTHAWLPTGVFRQSSKHADSSATVRCSGWRNGRRNNTCGRVQYACLPSLSGHCGLPFRLVVLEVWQQSENRRPCFQRTVMRRCSWCRSANGNRFGCSEKGIRLYLVEFVGRLCVRGIRRRVNFRNEVRSSADESDIASE